MGSVVFLRPTALLGSAGSFCACAALVPFLPVRLCRSCEKFLEFLSCRRRESTASQRDLEWPRALVRAALLWRRRKQEVLGCHRRDPAVPESGLDLGSGKVGAVFQIRLR